MNIFLKFEQNLSPEFNSRMVSFPFNDYFTDIAKNIGPDDVVKNDENLLSCLWKHDIYESNKCIRNFIRFKKN